MPFFSKDTQKTQFFEANCDYPLSFNVNHTDTSLNSFLFWREFPPFGSCVLFLFHLAPPDWATKGKGGGERRRPTQRTLTERKKQLKKAKIAEAEAEEADPLHKHKVSLDNHHHGREDG